MFERRPSEDDVADYVAEDDYFDPMCAICDDGGHVILCEGKCMRSFHATVEDGAHSCCESLGLTYAELQAMQNVAFYCENCKHKKHQCFACGELGSSDESSSPEVFCCVDGACGFFYHPYCVAKLLHPWDNAAAKKLQQRIAAGEQFACPAHRCHVCKEAEVKSIKELQFAVCRRCPLACHRKCLPREIATEEDVDMERGIIQRAWEHLIPDRVSIYCLDHEIDPNILTPVRDHIKFPGPSATTVGASPVVPTDGASSPDAATSHEASSAPSVSGDEDDSVVSLISRLSIDEDGWVLISQADDSI